MRTHTHTRTHTSPFVKQTIYHRFSLCLALVGRAGEVIEEWKRGEEEEEEVHTGYF